MARELHDELGQQLTVIQPAGVPLLDQPDAGPVRRVAVLVEEAFDSLGRLVRGWQPAALDGQGPTAALRALGRETSRRTALHVRVRVSGTEARVPHPVALAGSDAFGLRGLQERVASLGGTRIAVQLPLSPEGPRAGAVPS